MAWKFNPNLKEFIESNPKMSLLGFTWATYWRMMLVILGIEFVLFAVFMLVAQIF
jgi:hypothetical protein